MKPKLPVGGEYEYTEYTVSPGQQSSRVEYMTDTRVQEYRE